MEILGKIILLPLWLILKLIEPKPETLKEFNEDVNGLGIFISCCLWIILLLIIIGTIHNILK